MKRVLRRTSVLIYMAGIAGALTFGASQALARPVQLTCRYNGGTWLGACVNNDVAECYARCVDANYPDSVDHAECQGGDPQGCCVCYL